MNTFNPSSAQVYRTTNGGTTWTDITGNLPAVPTWSAKIDTDPNQTIYVSNETGVYLCRQSWRYLDVRWEAVCRMRRVCISN